MSLVRTLPTQAVHLPFQPGPYRMSMDLTAVPESAWFEIDSRYDGDLAERRRLLDQAHGEVFGTVAGSEAARAEALALIATALTAHHPGWFRRDGDVLHNILTEETWDLSAPSLDPLEIAGRLVQEDLCLIQETDAGPVFTAAVLCFPSRWRLADKLGKALADVHGAVPLYADRLAGPVDRFMQHLKPNRIACRLNWSVLDDPALFQPGGKWRVEGGDGITAANAGDRLFLRVERQTLRRLPDSHAVLFGIRVHVYPLADVISPRLAPVFAEAVAGLPPAVVHYKSVGSIRDALLEWLAARSEPARAGD
jgi:dimethylamine monooxygenase subunit A